MKKFIIKSFDKIIVILLGITGAFTGCNLDCSSYADVPLSRFRYPEGTITPEYGVRMGEFVIAGDIKNKENGKPIPNIQIIAVNSDTLYTDSQGKYIFKFRDFSLSNPQLPDVRLKIEDIDGVENGGKFASQEINVTFTDADKMNKRKCEGFYVKTENIKLEKEDTFIPLYGVGSAPFKP
jgi:putative lipoprotein (rSAM/lipoprotein system)